MNEIEVEFNDDNIINRVVNDLTTTEASIKRFFVDVFSDYNPNESKIVIKHFDNGFQLNTTQNISIINNFKHNIKNIGFSDNKDKIYETGLHGLNYLKYLGISEKIKLYSGLNDEAYELTRNGYKETNKWDDCESVKNGVSVRFTGLKKDKVTVRRLMQGILENVDDHIITYVENNESLNPLFVGHINEDGNISSVHYREGNDYSKPLVIEDEVCNRISDEVFHEVYETDYFYATYSPDNMSSGGVYINSVKVDTISNDTCGFVENGSVNIYMKTDKQIELLLHSTDDQPTVSTGWLIQSNDTGKRVKHPNHNYVRTPSLSPDSMRLEGEEDFINHICNVLEHKLYDKYGKYVTEIDVDGYNNSDYETVIELTDESIQVFLNDELVEKINDRIVKDITEVYLKIGCDELVIFEPYKETVNPYSLSDAYRRKLPREEVKYDIKRISEN